MSDTAHWFLLWIRNSNNNCEDVWHFSWQNQAHMCNLSCMSYASNTHTYCFICWSLYAYQFHSISICYQLHRTDFTSIMLSWLCTPNCVKDRDFKGNKQKQQTNERLGVTSQKAGNPNRASQYYLDAVARHQSGLSPHGSVPMIAIWPKNITFPVLGPMSYPYRRMQRSLLELKWCFMTGNPKSDFFKFFQDVF